MISHVCICHSIAVSFACAFVLSYAFAMVYLRIWICPHIFVYVYFFCLTFVKNSGKIGNRAKHIKEESDRHNAFASDRACGRVYRRVRVLPTFTLFCMNGHTFPEHAHIHLPWYISIHTYKTNVVTKFETTSQIFQVIPAR